MFKLHDKNVQPGTGQHTPMRDLTPGIVAPPREYTGESPVDIEALRDYLGFSGAQPAPQPAPQQPAQNPLAGLMSSASQPSPQPAPQPTNPLAGMMPQPAAQPTPQAAPRPSGRSNVVQALLGQLSQQRPGGSFGGLF